MICYLPFTQVKSDFCELIAQNLEPLIVYTPLTALISESMGAMQQQGLLEVRTPSGVDEPRIMDALQGLKSWAQLHDGHIGDMIHYLNTNPEHSPFVDETAPTQIQTQIRHFNEGVRNDEPDAVGQAALFLALAQEYDQHQHRLSLEFRAVMDMERDMYADMGGDTGPLAGAKTLDAGVGPMLPAQDPGRFLTARRLQAWARIVLQDARPTWLYLTPSAAVFDYLKALWPEVIVFPVWHLSPQAYDLGLNERRRAALQAWVHAQNLKEQPRVSKLCGHPVPEGRTLSIVGLPGALMDRLLPKPSDTDGLSATQAGVSGPWHHTLIGLVA